MAVVARRAGGGGRGKDPEAGGASGLGGPLQDGDLRGDPAGVRRQMREEQHDQRGELAADEKHEAEERQAGDVVADAGAEEELGAGRARGPLAGWVGGG